MKRALLATLFAGMAVHSPAAQPKAGHLVIIGGGLEPENAAIYNKILDLGGEGTGIGIVPTASGTWQRSANSYVEDFTNYGAGDRVEIIPVHMDDYDAAKRPEIAEQIARQRILFFTGGDQSRIMTAFRPEGEELDSYRAMLEILDAGGVIAGSSAGAAMMSDPCIRWGNSAEALLIGTSQVEDRGVLTGQGMGFFPYGMTDQHFSERGRFGRLVAALGIEGIDLGFGVAEDRGFHVDLSNHTVSGVGGTQAVMIIDVSGATREALSWRGIRVSMLGSGDTFDVASRTITPAGNRITVEINEGGGGAQVYESSDVWGSMIIAEALAAIALPDNGGWTALLRDDNFQLHFRADDQSRLYIAPDQGADRPLNTLDFAASGVLLDIIAGEGANGAASALFEELSTPQIPSHE